jgi:hypothetical protein
MSERFAHPPGVSALELLRQRAQTALDIWIEEWAASKLPSAVLTVGAVIDPEQWRSHACYQLRDANGGLWIRASVADRARLTQCIFGPGPAVASRDVMEEIASMAAVALSEELRSAVFGESPLPPAELVTHLPAELLAGGSDAVEMLCAPPGLRVIVDAGVWCTLPR